jgi:hypothetical protein
VIKDGMDFGPPETEYPEGHSPFCVKECDHPIHDLYDEWVKERDNLNESTHICQ